MSPSAPPVHGAEADLDAYAAQAAHQLGEAVALMRGYLALLEQRAEHDEELDGLLLGLNAGTVRAQRFVDDLLDLAASSRPEPQAARVALGEALAAAERGLADELRAGHAVVTAGPLPDVHADRDLVARLLCHLLRAALAAGARSIGVAAAHDDGMVRVEVRDDGRAPIGDALAPFARARGRGPLVGAGVGLVVARRIAEQHGGAMTLEHEDGVTVSSFTLPAGD